MKDIMNIAVVNFESAWGDIQRNLKRILGYIESAAKRGADLIVFPETALTGYEEDTKHTGDKQMHRCLAETVPGPSSNAVERLTKEYGVYAVYGFAERIGGEVYNSAVVIGPEGIIGSYQKMHLPFAESCWAARGNKPFMFDTSWGKIGVSICYDTYVFPEIMRYYRCMGCRLHINPTAVDTVVTAQNVRDSVEYLSANNCIYIASANGIGSYRNRKGRLLGGSHVIGPSCEVPRVQYYVGKPFGAESSDEAELYIGTIDLSYVEKPFLAKQFNRKNPDFRAELYVSMYQEIADMQKETAEELGTGYF